jgi:hypothetical protein
MGMVLQIVADKIYKFLGGLELNELGSERRNEFGVARAHTAV